MALGLQPKDNEKSVLKKCRTLKFFLCHLKICVVLAHIHPVLLSVPFLCLVSIKCLSFVYCIVSLQRTGKFSIIYADIWIPCLKVGSSKREPSAFWPLAGSLARAEGLTWVTQESLQSGSLIWLSQASTFYFFSSVCYHVNKTRWALPNSLTM